MCSIDIQTMGLDPIELMQKALRNKREVLSLIILFLTSWYMPNTQQLMKQFTLTRGHRVEGEPTLLNYNLAWVPNM